MTEPAVHADGPVLIVEADGGFRERLRVAVADAGMDAVAVASGSAALEAARVRLPRVVLVAMTPTSSGSQLWTSGLRTVSALRAEFPALGVLVIGDPAVVGELELRSGAVPVLPRGDLGGLVAAVGDPSAAATRCPQHAGGRLGGAGAPTPPRSTRRASPDPGRRPATPGPKD